jgi:DNA adenine methylase
MKQLSSPGFSSPERIVNVASVKQRSPFRYPGGKTWLVPLILQWLTGLPPSRRVELIEPFAGGAIVGLSVAFERLVEHVTLVELDDQVAAVWNTIISEDQGTWLASQIRAFNLTSDTVDALLARENLPVRERALQTIVKNRVNRGGILAAGAGKVKWGENGKGIASRWYPDTLAKRILDIVAIRDRLSFIHDDGLHVIRQNIHRQDIAFFIDPPYTAAGKKPGSRLYTCSDLDHNMLFELVSQTAGDFLMTYDDVEDIRQLASQWEFETQSVAMKNTHHVRKTELLIGRDLSWLR